jgi:hypothetical protein
MLQSNDQSTSQPTVACCSVQIANSEHYSKQEITTEERKKRKEK